jgi:acyl-CoA thioesterase I
MKKDENFQYSIKSVVISFLTIFLLSSGFITAVCQIPGEPNQKSGDYLTDIKRELMKKWPGNRTINLVFHGHSVPSGYFKTPVVNTIDAYPHQLLRLLKEVYPYAVINIITTAIGGENSVQGEKRFVDDVLNHKPDVLFIDYALNDRRLGTEASRAAMEKMIVEAQRKSIKILLLTPSPDQRVDITSKDNELEPYVQIIRDLAGKYECGLADSYLAFREIALAGESLEEYMSQVNHPNEKGHHLIAREIMQWFLP